MQPNETPPGTPGAPDWGNVTLRTKQEIPKPTRFSPGLAAGIWCFVGAVIVVFANILNPSASGVDPVLQALLTGMCLVLLAYLVGGITWRLRGREDGAGRTAFAVFVGMMALGQILLVSNDTKPSAAVRDPAPLLNATASAMKAHFETRLPKLAEAGIAAEVETRLAAFDQAAAKEKDDAGRARYATVRNLLGLGIASDLRVGVAIDALLANPSNDFGIARDPAAMAKMKAANAAFKAAAERRYADDTDIANRIDADLQAAPFSAAEREQLQSLLRRGAVAGRKITEQVTALVELTRASEAAFEYLAANPGTWRVEDGEVRFNNGLLARDYSPFENELERTRHNLQQLVK